MIGIILGITIPILYLAVGSAVGIYIYDKKPDSSCRRLATDKTHHRSSCNRGTYLRHPGLYPEFKDAVCTCRGHDSACDCALAGIFGGMFWPVTAIFICVYALMKGKSPKGTRMSRYQKKMKRVQDNIARMEKELGL